MSVETAIGSEMFNAAKEQYGLGDEITGETSFEEFEIAITNALQNSANTAETPAE